MNAAATRGAAALRTFRIGEAVLRVDDNQPTFWDKVEAGRWEPGTLRALAGLLAPGTVLVDLGAWVGPVTLYGAGLGAEVIAVEADPIALRQLTRNLAANPGLSERVTVLHRAAASKPGPVRLGTRRKPGDSMSSVLNADLAGAWEVEAVTPAELAALAGPARPRVVKIDLEGAEYGLLPALGPLVDTERCAVLLSLHPGLLAEAGEPDPHGAAIAALEVLSGWESFGIGRDGPEPCPVNRASLGAFDTWLFESPVPRFAPERPLAMP